MTDLGSDTRGGLASTALGGLALVLALATAWQSNSNQALQKQVVDGQAQLAKAQTLANLDNSLVQLLAKAAVDNNDPALRDLLARNGVTFKANAAPQPAPASSDADDKK
jgi:hypothetical protein